MGEPSYGSVASALEASDEAIALAVRGGELTIVVPPDTSADGMIDRASVLRGTLHLETDVVLTFEIQDGAMGAYFEHEAATLHARRQECGGVGLFTLAASPVPSAGNMATARNLMQTDVVTVVSDTLVQEVARLLALHETTRVLVVEADRLVGTVTEADVMGKQKHTVADIMSRDVITTVENTPADVIAKLLTERRIHTVPVVRAGRPVGIITHGDLVRWLATSSSAQGSSIVRTIS